MKKLFALLMAVMMVVTMFAACGVSNAPETTGAAADATNDATGEAAGTDAGAIKLGMCGPLTGGAAVYGTAVKAGMEIAVEEINAKGGLQFELNFQDDEADGEKGVNAYNNLKDWGMQILYGCTTTGSGGGATIYPCSGGKSM